MPKMDERIRDLATDIATAVKGKVGVNDPRVPIVMTAAAYAAITPIDGQGYVIQG